MEPTSSVNDHFTELLAQVREGSPEAIQTLVDTYGRYVLVAVRRHLNGKIRNQYDSIDFSQAVWGSFFRLSKSCPEFEKPSQLIAYLVRISKNKVIDECRKRLNTQRYDVGREQQVPGSGIKKDLRRRGSIPTPSAIVTAKERLEQLLEDQPEVMGSIVRMRASGATFDEIAEATGMNERHIRRVIKRLESRIKK